MDVSKLCWFKSQLAQKEKRVFFGFSSINAALAKKTKFRAAWFSWAGTGNAFDSPETKFGGNYELIRKFEN